MKGLTNIGNTCYINTTLQCLANCNVFLNYFLKTFKSSDFLNRKEKEKEQEQEQEQEQKIDENQRKKQEQKILDHFVLLQVRDVYQKLFDHDVGVTPRGLIASLERSTIGKFLRIRSQNDMHEFLNLFLDLFVENTNGKGVIITGKQQMHMTCSICDYRSINKETFTSIMLSFPEKKDKNIWNLIDLINYAFQDETIDERKCDNCQNTTQGKKTIMIEKFPKILTFMIKRYNYDGKKLEDLIDVPYKINLSHLSSTYKQYKIENTENDPQSININDTKMKYAIKSIACHMGDLDDGHYFSLIYKKDEQKWYEVDDDHVTDMGSKTLSSSYYFVLFYERIE